MSSAGACDAVGVGVSVLYSLYLRCVCGRGGGGVGLIPPAQPSTIDVRKKCKKITTCGVESAFVKNAQCVLYMNNVHDT